MLHVSFRFVFFISVVGFFVTAHSAPAKATRPVVEASQAFRELRSMKSWSLEDVLKGKKLGLSSESAGRQEQIKNQAKRFISFRTAASFYETICTTESRIQNDAFCLLENDRRKIRESIDSDDPTPPVFERRVSLEDLKKADVEELSKSSFSALNRAMAQADTSQDIVKLVDRLRSHRTCYSSALYLAAATKTEEFFPESEEINKARALYRKASECSTDELSMRARYRYSLLSVWQNSCDKVDRYLAEIESDSKSSSYHSRARYWRHQCAIRSGSTDIKVATERALLKNHPLSYHNLAVNGDNEQMEQLIRRAEPVKVSFRSLVRPDLNLRIAGIEALILMGKTGWAGEYLDRMSNQLTGAEPEFRLYTAALANRSENMIAKFKIMASLFEDSPRMLQASTLKMYFPLSYFEHVQSKSKSLDPYLVISLIRQESAFNHRARSPVGARGLMQVMPATARSIASVSTARLFDPKTNIQVGTKYFLHRLNQFNGDVGLTLAAYNAGASRVDRWVKRYNGADKVLFMDLIPFRETRDYVATILRNHYWYTRLYDKKSISRN